MFIFNEMNHYICLFVFFLIKDAQTALIQIKFDVWWTHALMKNVHDFLKQTVCQYFFYKSFMKIRLSNDIILQFHNDIIKMKKNGNLMFSETVNVPLNKGV